MRVLVTGGTGFLGSHCVEALAAAGHDVRLLVRTPAKIAATFDPLGVRIESHVQGDMADPHAVDRALEGCDAVLHTAATMYGGADVLEANLAGVRNVIGGAVERGIDPPIYISSVGAMFPPSGPVIRVDDPIGEHETVYGRSKAEGERYVRSLQAQGAAVTNIYPGGVYGPRDPVIGETMKGLRDAIRFGWPITTGGVSIVDARDVAHIVAACLEPGRGPRRYMASGHFLTWSEFTDCCEMLTGKKMRRVPAPPVVVRAFGRAIDVLQRLLPFFEYPLTHEAALFLTQLVPGDNSATEKDLGIEFRPTAETLSDSIRWLAEAGELGPKHAGRLAAEAP
jgi:nucleoside-diphosphate-sugar epimerase